MKESNVYPNQISIREYGLAKAQEQEVKKAVRGEMPPMCFRDGIVAKDCKAFIKIETLDLVKERIKEKIVNSDNLLKLKDEDLVNKLLFVGAYSNVYFDKFSSGKLGKDNIIALPIRTIDVSEIPLDTVACIYLGNLTGDSKKDKRKSTHLINKSIPHPLTMLVGSQLFIKPTDFVSGRISNIYNKNSFSHK